MRLTLCACVPAKAGIACAGNARRPSGTRARTKPPFTNPVFSNGLGGLDLAFSNPQIFYTMKHILAKVDRIRASGTALVQVPEDSPHAIHNGKIFKVQSMGTPGVKCRISLLINDKVVDLTLTDVL